MNNKNIEIGDIVVAPAGIDRAEYNPDYKNDPPGTTYKVLAIWPHDYYYDWLLLQADNGCSTCYDFPDRSAEEIYLELFDVDDEGLPGMLEAIRYCKENKLNVWEISLKKVELYQKGSG